MREAMIVGSPKDASSKLALLIALSTVALTLQAPLGEVPRPLVRDEEAIDKAKAKRLRKLARNQEIFDNRK